MIAENRIQAMHIRLKEENMATSYVHFSKEQKERARQTDIASLLERQGERLKKIGSEYEWENGGTRITVRGNLWYDHYEKEGGDAVSFVRKFFEKDYPQAIEFLIGERGTEEIKRATPVPKREKEAFVLPKRNENMRRAYAYLLLTRGIDKEVLNTFIAKKMIYESAEYHNVVFVGYDEKGVAQHANMRSASDRRIYKGNAPNSVPEYSFHWKGTSESIYVFEAPIDMMSFISMHKEGWQRHSYAACCGTSSKVLFQMLKDNPNIKKVYLCLDNDAPGRKGMISTVAQLEEGNFAVEVDALIPKHKDWNQDLINPEDGEEENEEEELCRQSQYSFS